MRQVLMMYRMRCLFGFLMIASPFCAPIRGLAVDAIDRLTLDRLEAVHQAVTKLKAERQNTARASSFKEYRANLHVHSAFSHDSRGKIDEITAAAKAAGTSILMFSEHPASHYDIYEDGHKGMRDGVLLIPGAESKGMLVYPRQSIKQVEAAQPQDLSDFVRGRDGLTFLSHLEERMEWEIQGLTGVEIYNTHADAKDEKRLFSSLKNPLWVLKSADAIRRYPQEAFSALQDYPSDYLKRWDQLCARLPHTGISANDAHQNIGLTVRLAEGGKVDVEDGLGEKQLTLEGIVYGALKPIPMDAKVGDVLFQLRLDAYENSLRHVGTHLLMADLSESALWQALNDGRAFVAFDWIADATGFDFSASVDKRRHEMGAHLKLADGTILSGKSPQFCHWRLIRNGQPAGEFDGFEFVFPVEEPGIYRVESWLKVADEDRVWVLSNPIYVESK